MRLLVCGDRLHKQLFPLDIVLMAFLRQSPNLHIITGGCRGADTFAAQWARDNNVPYDVYPADWRKYGRAAGPIRNKQMLTVGKPDLVVAFHPDLSNSKGTLNMVRQAYKAGVGAVAVNRLGQLQSVDRYL